MDKLLPCPFCGGEAELKHYQNGDWQIFCYHSDECIMRESDLENRYWDNVQTLVEQWNTRAERTCKQFRMFNLIERECDRKYYSWRGDEMPNYCPNCGAKVVE